MLNYPDGLSGWQICHMEGHTGNGHCPRCGDVNYGLLGYYGALARWSKTWGISEEETERRFAANLPQQPRDEGAPDDLNDAT